MMGERHGVQDRLFYEFDFEAAVPADHFLRKIDAVLDLSKLRTELVPHSSLGNGPPARVTIIPVDLASAMWKLQPVRPSIGSYLVVA